MKKRMWVKAFVVCAIIFVSLATYKALQIREAIAFGESFPEHSESVKSSYTGSVNYLNKLSVIGEVKAPQSVALYSESPGRIIIVGYESGERVKKHQILIQLDISEEEALLGAAKARLDFAESIYKRNEDLYKSNAVSEEIFDTSRVELATVKADIARLKSIIRKKTITAPFDGVTGIHDFEEGLFLLDNVLITQLIGKQEFLWIDFEVPQFYPALEKGDEVEVRALRNAESNESPDWITAHILAKSAQISKENRSYKYRAEISVSQFSVAVNAGVEVRVPVTMGKRVIAVPVTAVQQDHLGAFVYLLKEDEASTSYRAARQNVIVVAKEGSLALITKGLELKQLVAGDGAFKLHPGLLVHSQIEPLVLPEVDQKQVNNQDNNNGKEG